MAAAILLLGLIAFLGWRQPPPGQFEPIASFPHWNWWWRPIEVNPQNRPPITNVSIDAIVAIPGSEGRLLVAAGYGGSIVHSNNGGARWKPVPSGTSQHLHSVTFATPRLGWAVGDGGTILHTADGGASWKPHASGTSADLHSVTFATPQSGWAVGEDGTILHTADGGVRWKTQASATEVEPLWSVTFATPQSGWAVGRNGTILHTDDGGVRWKSQRSRTREDLLSVSFVTPQSGWVVSYGGTIHHTTDGGVSWETQESGVDPPPHSNVVAWSLTSVTFVTSELGWAVGYGGTILHTVDGGVNWTPELSGTSDPLFSVTFATPQSGWATGMGGTILHTADGGASWKPEAHGRSMWLNSVAFANPQSGWMVGQASGLDGQHRTILRTSDSGVSWKPETSGTSAYLTSVAFATPQLGWAVGWDGTMIHTGDGGASWKPEASGTDKHLKAVTFATPQSGWAVGEYGTIVHTGDGGVSWKPEPSGTDKSLSSVTFATPQEGWAVGEGGIILHTGDGGVRWTPEPIGVSPYYLYGVTFTTPQSGWAVGTAGTILHTADGGVSWKAQASGTNEAFLGLAFATQESGWAVGTAGTILHTADGGASWKAESSGTRLDLNGVTFTTPKLGWVVGNGGTILHTGDGGQHWKRYDLFPYRHYPAPSFYVAICATLSLFVWALIPKQELEPEEYRRCDPARHTGHCFNFQKVIEQTLRLSRQATELKDFILRNIKMFVCLGALLFLILVISVSMLSFRAKMRPLTGTPIKSVPQQPFVKDNTASRVADLQKQLPEMRQYVDADFGFSFWYPAAGSVTRWNRATDPAGSEWYRGGTTFRSLSVRVPSDFYAGGNETVGVEELYVPTGVLTVTGSKETISFGMKNGIGDGDYKTVGGLPLYVGDEHGGTLIVPLDRTHFVVLDHEPGTDTHLYLAQSIVASGPDGAKGVSSQQLADAVHIEAMKLGVLGRPIGAGWSTDDEHIYNTMPVWKVLAGVDPKTFAILPGAESYFATDSVHVYYGDGGEAIPKADPKTFMASGRDSAQDALHKYKLSGGKWKVDGVAVPQ